MLKAQSCLLPTEY
ncbi:hypothetical protein D041_3848, partial [Vibrio parahaemolyticus EKP-008]